MLTERRQFSSDMAWSRQYLPHMKAIVGAALIGEAPDEEDQQRNTDLIVLRLEAVRIGCRVRQHQYLARYADEFTIRLSRPSGMDTELTKIMTGWGDYFLYGFAAADGSRLCAWLLGNLHVFRRWYWDQWTHTGREPGETQQNGDGTRFRVFKIDDLPRDFVVTQRAPSNNGVYA